MNNNELSRRGLFNIIPAAGIACLGCAQAVANQQPPPEPGHSWTEKADLTWEEIFRFAFQKDLIPMLKELAAQVGREKFVAMLKDACDEVVRKKTAGRPPVVPDLVAFAANLKRMPPLMQHALQAEMMEATAEAVEYRVTSCLWAKTFRDQNAGDIGYAMICYPDYAVAKGLNPKLRLARDQTLMQGDNRCVLRYTMDA